MSFRLILASMVLNLLLVPSANAQTRLDDVLEPIRLKYGLPALAAAVAKDGRIIAIGAVGTRVLGAEIPVAVDDRFHIGSDTKAMTATFAGKLVDEGKLSWTSTIGDVLGPVIPGLKPGFAAISLEQLLSHTSGLPSDNEEIAALYYGNAYESTLTEYRCKMIADWGTKHDVDKADIGHFHYANLGFIIVGAMIEQITAEPWENLMQKEIFEPLGLKTAGLGPQATMGLYDAPVGHAIDEKSGKITPRPWGPGADAPAVVGPAGIAHMSVGDFATWAAWNAAEGKRGPALIKPETLRHLHAPHVTMEIPNPKPGTPKSGSYGFGWGLVKFDWAAKPLLTHNGSNSMNLATILVDTENDLGITIDTNFPGEKADAALAELTEILYKKFGPMPANP
jgi:CubicO group peptidase (beta-lactamase class C family)